MENVFSNYFSRSVENYHERQIRQLDERLRIMMLDSGIFGDML